MKTVNLPRLLLIFVGISGCFSVLFGAWLAHSGQNFSDAQQASLATAHQYQLIHTLALLAVLFFYQIQQHKMLLLSALLFALGIVFFSVSIYIKILFLYTLIGKLAPIGGIAFAFAWFNLVFVGIKKS